jgi:acyl-coenzyme A thioesterase PaaI-like protein
VLTAEFKVNLLAPAGGDSLVAEGQVVRAGRTLTSAVGTRSPTASNVFT